MLGPISFFTDDTSPAQHFRMLHFGLQRKINSQRGFFWFHYLTFTLVYSLKTSVSNSQIYIIAYLRYTS